MTTQYTQASLIESIRREHKAAQSSMKDALLHAIATGQLLAEAKTQIKHGEFKAFIADNFEFSYRSAASYMKVARNYLALNAEERARLESMSYADAIRHFSAPKDVEGDERTTTRKTTTRVNGNDAKVAGLEASLEEAQATIAKLRKVIAGQEREIASLRRGGRSAPNGKLAQDDIRRILNCLHPDKNDASKKDVYTKAFQAFKNAHGTGRN